MLLKVICVPQILWFPKYFATCIKHYDNECLLLKKGLRPTCWTFWNDNNLTHCQVYTWIMVQLCIWIEILCLRQVNVHFREEDVVPPNPVDSTNDTSMAQPVTFDSEKCLNCSIDGIPSAGAQQWWEGLLFGYYGYGLRMLQVEGTL